MNKKPKKILVIRNDKLGDFMLSYPAFSLLKNALPETEIHALVQPYTQTMAELCEWIDVVQLDQYKKKGFKGIYQLYLLFKEHQYDAVITLYSETHTGLAACIAKIPYRLAPATKIAQVFYNHRLKQKRSRSEQPEYEYNRDLARQYLRDINTSVPEYHQAPFLYFSERCLDETRNSFISSHNIPKTKRLVYIHPGSGGSANNLSISQFAELAHGLSNKSGWQLVICAGPDELQQANHLLNLTKSLHPVIFHSTSGLEKFAQHIAISHLFVSGSTGPLHIAGALNIPTTGFYTRRRSATNLRWQTLNSENNRLAFSPPENAQPEDMQAINISECANIISATFLT
jgi:ADP-heptose:LPS heptosyltransferase